MQGEFELPTRLSVAAADLILSLTEALARTNSVFNCLDDKHKAAGTGERNRPVMLLPSTPTKKKVNKISKSSDYKGMEKKLLLWDHLDNLIILVERLTAVCFITYFIYSVLLDWMLNLNIFYHPVWP